jgi:glycosyltransferase involved in cell wall biosynthesis
MKSQKISVIVPCYNQAKYLDASLQSVLNQTYQDWECIIVNDGSNDNTESIGKKWAAKDKRFYYLHKENGGLSSARNSGLNVAKGDYIQFLDADDFLNDRKFELSLQQFLTDPSNDIKVAISNFRMFIDNPNITTEPYCHLKEHFFNFETLLNSWDYSFTIPIHCGFFDRILFENFRFPEILKAKEDWVMWVSLFHTNCKATFINEPLALYRRNPESMTSTKDMLPDFINACIYFKDYLSNAEYNDFLFMLISRYYRLNKENKLKLGVIKKSNIYRSGLLIKKALIKFGVLKLFKNLFLKVLQY